MMRCEVVCNKQPPALCEVRLQRFTHEVGFVHAPIASAALDPRMIKPVEER